MSYVDADVERAAQVVSEGTQRGGVAVAELTHALLREQFSEYLDGALDACNRERVERHLGACASCTAYLNTLRATIDLAGEVPTTAAPAGAKAAILRKARAGQ